MKRGMLLVSFGTSHEETRMRTIDAIESKVREAFPKCTHYSAWTSGVIIKKVAAERGEHHDTLDEALARIDADSIEDLVVSTTCLMQGAEMTKIKDAVSIWARRRKIPVYYAEPLLNSPDDRVAVARVLCEEFADLADDEAVLLMGHGSPVRGNEVYSGLQEELDKLGCKRIFVATVEGEPKFEDAIPLVEASGARRVHLAPLMIVAGDHAKNDLTGEDKNSWASMVSARGLEPIPHLKGLGEYAGIQQLVCDHVNQALVLREVALRG